MKKLIFSLLTACMALCTGAQEGPMLGDKTFGSHHPDWAQDAVIYEVNLRQGTPGRTLKSAAAELPRLKDLGVDIVWLMPIHPISKIGAKGPLGSYYAVQDYLAVNPEFGDMDDLRDYVDRAHALGMKVIIDEVYNHTGRDHAWVNEHPEFYARNDKGEMFGPYDWTDVYQLDYNNPELRRLMTDNLKFWVKEADIDGFRCDVAFLVPTDFWEQARTELEAIKPVFMLAEAAAPQLTVAAFDADYAWPMKDVFNAIAATKGINKYANEHKQNLPKMSALDIDKLLAKQEKQYPKDTYRMNMITNHDLNSWDGTEFDRYGEGTGAFALLSYTLPGMPMMYTGQEVGFDHPFLFFEADTIQPDYRANQYTVFYQMLNALKHAHPALRAGKNGGKMVRYETKNPDLYVFSRQLPDDEVLVMVNLSDKPTKVEFKKNAPSLTGLSDYFNGEAQAVMPVGLDPWQYRVFVPQKK